jgi:hypothetical protein
MKKEYCMESYRPSGAFSPLGILLSSTAGITAAVLLGVLYSYMMVNISATKLHVLAPICLGGGIGAAVAWGAKFGKIRNVFVACAYGFICGLIGVYVAWGADRLARMQVPNNVHVDYVAAFAPHVVIGHIKQSYLVLKPNGGDMTGPFMVVFWSLEAIIVIGISTGCAPHLITGCPFCENCKRWIDVKPINRNLSLVGAEQSMKALESGELSSLASFNLAQNELVYLELQFGQCSSCDESNYLTVYFVKTSLDRKGKMEVEKKPLIRNMLIAAEYVPLVKGTEFDE